MKLLIKFSFLGFTLVLLFNACTESPKSSGEQLPNIVMIVADDLGYPYAGFMGDTLVQTPNLDKLANMGTVFRNGMVTQAHCAPSLRTMVTGLHSARYDFVSEQLQEEKRGELTQGLSQEDSLIWEREFPWRAMPYFKTIPEFLAEKGYASFQGGKWWEFSYQNGGFTHGMSTGWTREDRKDPDFFVYLMGNEGLKLGRKTNQPVFDFIEEQKENPFFLWWAPDLPHWPFNAPDKYYDIYKDRDIAESAKKYYANVTWFDDALGEVTDYFEEKGLMENTLFIYVNDNGWDQAPNAEYRYDSALWHHGGPKGKGSYYDMTYRTPLIFTWKGTIPAGRYKDELASSMDLLPTILDYAGMEKPDYLRGISLKSNIAGTTGQSYDQIVGNVTQLYYAVRGKVKPENPGPFDLEVIEGYWVRTPEYHYIWDVTNDEELLFDMEKDPYNNNNIAHSNQELISTFKPKITEWRNDIYREIDRTTLDLE